MVSCFRRIFIYTFQLYEKTIPETTHKRINSIAILPKRKEELRMEERRRINRVSFDAKSVIVVCDSLEKVYADVINLSPLGMAVKVPAETESLLNKDIIIVAETLIMYADVVREDANEDGTKTIALNAKKFTNEVLEYLFNHIALDEDK